MKPVVVISLIAVVLISSGCCCLCNTVNPEPQPGPTAYSDGVAHGYGTIDPALAGGWGALGGSGDLVDAAGNYVGDAYSGEGYRFNSDGTYVYRIIGSGLVLNGLAETRGYYSSSGDALNLVGNKDCWYPFEGDQTPAYKNKPSRDMAYTYRIDDDGNTLVLIEQGSEYENVLHRTD